MYQFTLVSSLITRASKKNLLLFMTFIFKFPQFKFVHIYSLSIIRVLPCRDADIAVYYKVNVPSFCFWYAVIIYPWSTICVLKFDAKKQISEAKEVALNLRTLLVKRSYTRKKIFVLLFFLNSPSQCKKLRWIF